MYLNVRHEVIRPLLEHLDEAFETFISRMNSVISVPILPNDGLTAEKMQVHPHNCNTRSTA